MAYAIFIAGNTAMRLTALTTMQYSMVWISAMTVAFTRGISKVTRSGRVKLLMLSGATATLPSGPFLSKQQRTALAISSKKLQEKKVSDTTSAWTKQQGKSSVSSLSTSRCRLNQPSALSGIESSSPTCSPTISSSSGEKKCPPLAITTPSSHWRTRAQQLELNFDVSDVPP